ncbi:hypothetical protein PGT21_034206 [Puccinia graminis f. sp. tritici]|uniref:Uncharacterized protein n=1 Tax=Puccinia graminis f. sp. tritici TaxID=56615 RepID=A0A5B0PDG0_PUCGR|nr:hypothetical protein PGT21_034206 [Puccinia graminis f. sp. tritici]KAA1125638.1 hypothetical protein PGTUg99_015319 [Puccinia graminis f. sp. tritici]
MVLENDSRTIGCTRGVLLLVNSSDRFIGIVSPMRQRTANGELEKREAMTNRSRRWTGIAGHCI